MPFQVIDDHNEEVDEIMSDSYTPVTSSTDSFVELKKRRSIASVTASASPESNVDSFLPDEFAHLAEQVLPPVDDEEVLEKGYHTWKIDGYRALNEQKVRGPTFKVGGIEWNILLFPKVNSSEHMALYLEPLQPKKINEETGEEEPLDPSWYVCAQFTLVVSNPKDSRNYVLNTSHQRFSKDATDWGFSSFLDLKSLYQPRKGNGPLVSENKLNITAFIKVLKDPTGVLWHNLIDYDSKKETGFVGFKNQGATCYLNSLLQSYFFTKSFRKAVYNIPTEGESPNDSVALALQRIFYQLQQSNDPIDTIELTKSFGWDTGDAFTQHDVQEMNRILMDRLEARMKGTSAEDSLNNTFVGKMKSYIKCIDVDYESARTEDFWDIQLNVKDLANLTESFQNYIEVELMNGENQYAAQDFGLQDAKKGVIFESFPNVLHLQLKRFEYDFNYDQLVKINDRHEFPDSIDLSPFLEHTEGSNPDPLIYDLHGVLVHAGDISTGHYYAMIKPDKTNNWYRFDDDRVWKVTKRQVFDENFGLAPLDNSQLMKMTRLQYQNYQLRRHTSAYMLVYIKRSELDTILPEVTENDLPKHVVEECQKEIEETARKRKELEESHLYLNINFYSESLFKRYQGFDLGYGERSVTIGPYTKADEPLTLKVLKTKKFEEIFSELDEKLNIKSKDVNFWIMNYRRNHTLRVSSRLDYGELTVGEIYEKFLFKKYQFANIWIEEPDKEMNHLIGEANPPQQDQEYEEYSEKLLIFLKYFDIESQTLKGLTSFYGNSDELLETIIPKINKLMGWDPNTQLELYEEAQPLMCYKLDTNKTFHKSELINGDIIAFQRSASNNDTDLLSSNPNDIYPYYTTAEQFYAHIRARINVKAQPLTDRPEDDEYVVPTKKDGAELNGTSNASISEPLDFWISADATYEELSKRISRQINVDAKNLRIFANFSGNRIPLKTNMNIANVIHKTSSDLIVPLFEYEVLNISLQELEDMKEIKVHWLTSGYIHYQNIDVLIPKTGTVKDLIDKLQSKVGFNDNDRDNLVLWSNVNFKFYIALYPEVLVKTLEPTMIVFAAILPEESKLLNSQSDDEEQEIETESQGRLIPVLQFNRDPTKLHGISFIFNLEPGEKLPETKARLHKKFGLGQKEFSKINFWCLDPETRKLRTLEDDSLIPYDHISESEYLCLDHPNRTSRQGSLQGGGITIK